MQNGDARKHRRFSFAFESKNATATDTQGATDRTPKNPGDENPSF